MDLAGRTALVTGASGGIGAATATRLARAGSEVHVHGRDPDRTGTVAASVGTPPIAVDLAVADGVERVLEQSPERVDLLVVATGVGWSGPFDTMDAEDLDALVELDLLTPLRLVRALLPPMIARGEGRIVLVTSVAGRTGVAGEAAYAACKAGLDAFAESLRLELAGTGVGVTTVVPAAVATGFFARRGRAYDRRFPRPVPPDLVARALVEAVLADRDDVHVPRWVRGGEVVRAVAPRAYRSLAARFGEHVRAGTPRGPR